MIGQESLSPARRAFNSVTRYADWFFGFRDTPIGDSAQDQAHQAPPGDPQPAETDMDVGSSPDGSHDERGPPTCIWFWNPFTLRFEDERLEAIYHETMQDVKMHSEFYTHILGIFPGLIFILVQSMGRLLPMGLKLLWLSFSFFMAPLFAYLCRYRLQTYKRWRVLFVLIIRWGVPFAFMPFGRLEEPPRAAMASVLGRICTKSPIANMSFVAWNLPFRFREHLLVHTVGLLISIAWAPVFCLVCDNIPDLQPIFEKFGSVVDTTVWWVFFMGVGVENGEGVTCWMVTMFMMIAMGYVIPTAMVYCTEICSRAAFLHGKVSQDDKRSLVKFKYDGLKVGVWGMICGLQLTWLLVSYFR